MAKTNTDLLEEMKTKTKGKKTDELPNGGNQGESQTPDVAPNDGNQKGGQTPAEEPKDGKQKPTGPKVDERNLFKNIWLKLLIIVILLSGIAGGCYFKLIYEPEKIRKEEEERKKALEKENNRKKTEVERKFKEALDSYNSKRYGSAINAFEIANSLNKEYFNTEYIPSLYYLGIIYFADKQHHTSFKDRSKSFQYLSQVPAKPDRQQDDDYGLGYYYLGYMYMAGDGTTQDISKGISNYEQAFKYLNNDKGYCGVFIGHYGLARLYYNGDTKLYRNKTKAKDYWDREMATNACRNNVYYKFQQFDTLLENKTSYHGCSSESKCIKSVGEDTVGY